MNHVARLGFSGLTGQCYFVQSPPSNLKIISPPLVPPCNQLLAGSGRRSMQPILALNAGKRMMNGFHEVVLKVRNYELDQFGVVNNSVYANYCQHGNSELIERIGVIIRAGDIVAVTELSMKFINPLRSGDKFVLKVRISRISASRIYFDHFIFKLPNEEPILEAKGAFVWLSKDYGPVRIPPEVRSKLEQFIGDDQEKSN